MADEQKRYIVNVSKNASEMLNDHLLLLVEVSLDAAEKLADDFDEAFDSLRTMPNRCPRFSTNNTNETYRKLVIGRYQLIFSVNEERGLVDIKYILDSRRSNDI